MQITVKFAGYEKMHISLWELRRKCLDVTYRGCARTCLFASAGGSLDCAKNVRAICMWRSDLRRITATYTWPAIGRQKNGTVIWSSWSYYRNILYHYNFQVKIPNFLKYHSSIMLGDMLFEIEIRVPKTLKKKCVHIRGVYFYMSHNKNGLYLINTQVKYFLSAINNYYWVKHGILLKNYVFWRILIRL